MARNVVRPAAVAALLLLAVLPGTVADATPPGTALSVSRPNAASGLLWGYVVSRRPRSVTYTPVSNDRGNSVGGVNSIIWTETGHYEVRMPGLANDESAVALSPVGTVARRCVVQTWFTDGADELIDLACFSPVGTAVDSPFVLTFLAGDTPANHPSPPGYGYGLANQPTAAGSIPTRSFNSHSGSSNSELRLAKGQYEFDFNDLGSSGGNVQVVAVANIAATCQATWDQSNAQMQATVDCRHSGLALADKQFDIILTDRVGLKGPGGTNVAYLTADQPTTSSYTASAARRFSTGSGAPTITRTAKGAYGVTLPGMPLGGAAVVTPLAIGAAMCSISSVAENALPQKIGVRCFDPQGRPKDAQFSLSYLR